MAFITQQTDVNYKTFEADEDGDLEALIAGVSGSSQSTLLMRKRKELREVDDALDFMNEEFAIRMKTCDERQKRFLAKQNDMKEQVIRFEKFIQENDAKKTRAENKSKQESRLYEQAVNKEKLLLKQLNILKSQSKRLSSRVSRLRSYPLFLERAIEASEGEYEEVNDMLNRHRTLLHAQRDLRKLVANGERENDNMRSKLNHLKLGQQNALLVHNSEIHRFQKKLEQLREESYKMELELERTNRYSNDRQRDFAQIVNSIRNLNARCIRSNHTIQSGINENESGTQEFLNECLNSIMFRLNNLRSICREYTMSGTATTEGGPPNNNQHGSHQTSGVTMENGNKQRRSSKDNQSKKSKHHKKHKSHKSSKHHKDRSSKETDKSHRRRSKSKKHKSKSRDRSKHGSKSRTE